VANASTSAFKALIQSTAGCRLTRAEVVSLEVSEQSGMIFAYHKLDMGTCDGFTTPSAAWLIRRGVLRKAPLTVCLSVVSSLMCAAQTNPSVPQRLPATVKHVLSYLPADTETIFVASKSFAMPLFRPDNDQEIRETSPDRMFELLPLDRFGLKDGLLQNYLMGERIELAIEGSRHFRPPSGLGEAPYEGCQIAVLEKANTSRGASFLKESANGRLKTDNVAGQQVTVFQERLEDDIWTTFVAFPKPNLVLACTDRDYLREVLERIGGRIGKRALPDTLAEWSFVDTHASFWGLRHYDKSQAGRDPTSPFVDRNILGMSDRLATGVALTFDSGKRNAAKVSYFSGVSDILVFLQKQTPWSMQINGLVDATASLPIRYRQTAPGVAEIEYELGGTIPADAFILVVVSVFGHVIYF